eukprot:TRINITY_DN3477_c0_g1_i1.p2 TRINITY_DN3477_c0_g1~~TRINITY_DN3477_c0_g1_i1.p2  ORF type:complete len:472 (+),score=114.84 TRINITY_DN3477_c0_g1_i1:199-1614(+)
MATGPPPPEAKKKVPSAALKRDIEERVRKERAAFTMQEYLLEDNVSVGYLAYAADYFQSSHYHDVLEERALDKRCGYPACSKPLSKGSGPSSKYRVSLQHHKVYDITDRALFCGQACLKLSRFYQDNLAGAPVYLRDPLPDPLTVTQWCDSHPLTMAVESASEQSAPATNDLNSNGNDNITPSPQAKFIVVERNVDGGAPLPLPSTSDDSITKLVEPKKKLSSSSASSTRNTNTANVATPSSPTTTSPTKQRKPSAFKSSRPSGAADKKSVTISTPDQSKPLDDDCVGGEDADGDDVSMPTGEHHTNTPQDKFSIEEITATLSPFATMWDSLASWITPTTRKWLEVYRRDGYPESPPQVSNEQQAQKLDFVSKKLIDSWSALGRRLRVNHPLRPVLLEFVSTLSIPGAVPSRSVPQWKGMSLILVEVLCGVDTMIHDAVHGDEARFRSVRQECELKDDYSFQCLVKIFEEE